jgi:hypothetical protein
VLLKSNLFFHLGVLHMSSSRLEREAELSAESVLLVCIHKINNMWKIKKMFLTEHLSTFPFDFQILSSLLIVTSK